MPITRGKPPTPRGKREGPSLYYVGLHAFPLVNPILGGG